MMKILNLFKKKQKTDPYAYMGSVGLSPKYMLMYQDAIKKIEDYEANKK